MRSSASSPVSYNQFAWLLLQSANRQLDVGQEEDWDAVKAKAVQLGATKMIIEDLQKEFVEELCFRAVQCNAIYEGRYLMGMSCPAP